MADHTMLFDEQLTEPNLRGKVYELEEPPGRGLVCVQLTARRGADWFFARRWVGVRGGRRLLYRTIDECERWGYRFAVSTSGREEDSPPPLPPKAPRATRFLAELDSDERKIFHELFPEETRLLREGYDWDHERVWRRDVALESDAFGRILERRDGILWEWVHVDDEFTWRRYPLERLVETPLPLMPRPVDR